MRKILNPKTAVLLAVTALILYERNKRRSPRIDEIDYGEDPTYVIGHKSPDSDSLASAVAYAKLLDALGIRAQAVVSEEINNEARFFMEKYNLKIPEIMNDAAGRQFVLVDHSSYLQAIPGMKEARVLTIIDHHEKGDICNDKIPLVKIMDVGATATMIYRMFNEYKVDIDIDTARVLLMGVMSDTKNLGKANTTYYDRKAYQDLASMALIDDLDGLYEQMIDASLSYEGMNDRQILYSDLKEYECDGVKYAIAAATGRNHEAMVELLDRMYDAAKADFEKMAVDYVFIKVRDAQNDNMYMAALGSGAVELLDSIYFNYDGSRYFIFDVSLSRKLNIVPMIDLAIKEKKK